MKHAMDNIEPPTMVLRRRLMRVIDYGVEIRSKVAIMIATAISTVNLRLLKS